MSIFRATPHRVGALLALLYLALLLATAGDLAMSRDESFYVLAADRYAEWFRVLAQDPSAARSKELIDRFWVENHEHPPLMKSLFALSHLAQERWSIFPRPSDAYRFPGMLSAALLLWLIVVFGSRLWNLRAGVMAAIFFATLPRVFYHAHLNCFDVPIVLMILWVTYAYWRSLERPRWALMAGIAYGFALATKHNSWVLPGVLFIHWLWVLVQARWARRQGREMRVHLFPWWLLAMAALGPPLFLGSWPWLWHEPWPRFQAYAAFHLHHDYYNMAYFGRNYFEPPFPISYPFVMTAFTLPLTTLLLMLVGLGMRARALLPEPLALRLWPRGLMRSDARASDVLLLGSALAPLLIIALPSTPIFGGTKHWFPAYPFLALYAGYAADAALRAARARAPFTWMSSLPRFEARARAALPSILALLFCAPGVAESAHSHPFGLSHYTLLAGVLGRERQPRERRPRRRGPRHEPAVLGLHYRQLGGLVSRASAAGGQSLDLRHHLGRVADDAARRHVAAKHRRRRPDGRRRLRHRAPRTPFRRGRLPSLGRLRLGEASAHPRLRWRAYHLGLREPKAHCGKAIKGLHIDPSKASIFGLEGSMRALRLRSSCSYRSSTNRSPSRGATWNNRAERSYRRLGRRSTARSCRTNNPR